MDVVFLFGEYFKELAKGKWKEEYHWEYVILFFYFVRINTRLVLPHASSSVFLFSEIILLMAPRLNEHPLFVFLNPLGYIPGIQRSSLPIF